MSKSLKFISAKDFFKKHTKGLEKLHIIDLRTDAEVAIEHLSECGYFPLQTLDQGEVKQYLQLQRRQTEEPVYFLCAKGPRAELAAEQLKNYIAGDLIVIKGGLGALKELGITVIQNSA